VKLARVELRPLDYRLRAPLRTGGGAIARRAGLAVGVCDAEGRRGRGEALPLPAAGTETLERCAAALRAAQRELPGWEGALDELLDGLERRWPEAPAARCALDVALHELEALRQDLPVARLLGAQPRARVAVNALLGAGEPAALRAEAAAALARGYSALKLKLGAREIDADLCRVAAVRALGGALRLRADANGAWSEPQTRAALPRLAALGLELLEQPTAPADLAALARLAADSPVPIAADEALASPAGRAALAAGALAPIAVLKPPVLGGLRAAARLAWAARAGGVRCVVTTTLDGPVGTAGALQLAAAVGDADLASGLAAAELLDTPFPELLRPRDGRLELPARAGLGLDPQIGDDA
jgi:o-succinylbenzoate synthase